MDGSESVRFNLDDTVEHNFNAYQDALEQYPESFSFLKLRYDQYLKTVPLYSKEIDVEEVTDISFEVVS
jgi:cytochrome c peroxidase